MMSRITVGITLLIGLATPRAADAECGDAGHRAAQAHDWDEAIRHYDREAADPRCHARRFDLALSAAIALQTTTRDGTSAERCAAAKRFRRLVDARPPAAIAHLAERGYADTHVFCATAAVPPTQRAPVVSLDTVADPGPAARAPTPEALVAASVTAPPAPLPALATEAAPAAWDGDALILGGAGLAAAGAALAYALLWRADADRADAQRGADLSGDPAVWDAAERRFDAANDRARAAGWTAYGLAGATAGLIGWWAARQLGDDDRAPGALATTNDGLGESRR